MTDIRILEYDNEMKESVRSLFLSIYPDNPILAERMWDDKNLPNHITTKIAFRGASIVGQANIFIKSELNRNANLGYHVCPKNRMQGIARSLSLRAVEAAKRRGITKVYIFTSETNKAAIGVARSIGFGVDISQNVEEGTVVFSKIL